MGVISGMDTAFKFTAVQDTAAEFQINYKGNLKPYSTSNLAGGTGRNLGVKDWDGWVRGYGSLSGSIFPGEDHTFIGTINQTGNVGATGPCIIEAIRLRGNHEEGGPIQYMVMFAADGALTLGSATAADATNPNPPNAIDMKVAVGGVDASDCFAHDVIVMAVNKPYSSSGTPGQFKRNKGRIDARIIFSVYEDTPSELYIPSVENSVVKVYVTSTTFWQFTNCRFDEIQGYGGNRENDRNVAATYVAWFNGTALGAGIGSIIDPAITTKWPPTP